MGNGPSLDAKGHTYNTLIHTTKNQSNGECSKTKERNEKEKKKNEMK